ncbi:MAG: methylglutaconyl-CoA hydratase [Xanthobacteraceae bacterium]|jgi:methylglutaconyl-CoA hydratase|nr:methylglutaconyl-CoA hydratase [Xanthobacteraceae bacterium]
MSFETIRIATDDRGIATLTLAWPERHNALSAAMIAELSEAAFALGTDPTVRVVVLAAEGESFCAGADLGWMKEQFAASRAQRIEEARRLAQMLNALYTLPKPLIGRVQGQAFGGGIGLISVCDVAIAANGARFALTETRLGLIPATIGPYVVARIGHAGARRVFMSGRIFGAAEAAALGLLHAVVNAEQLDAAIELEVKPYLSTAPGAVAAAKDLLHTLGPSIDDAVIEATIARLADIWETSEAREGVAAFFDKRPPHWRK